jgi:hypothetical protein
MLASEQQRSACLTIAGALLSVSSTLPSLALSSVSQSKAVMMRGAQIFQIVVRLAWSAFIFALRVIALYL